MPSLWGVYAATALFRRAEISSGGVSRIYEDGILFGEEGSESDGTVVRLTPDRAFFVCSVAEDAAAIRALGAAG